MQKYLLTWENDYMITRKKTRVILTRIMWADFIRLLRSNLYSVKMLR